VVSMVRGVSRADDRASFDQHFAHAPHTRPVTAMSAHAQYAASCPGTDADGCVNCNISTAIQVVPAKHYTFAEGMAFSFFLE